MRTIGKSISLSEGTVTEISSRRLWKEPLVWVLPKTHGELREPMPLAFFSRTRPIAKRHSCAREGTRKWAHCLLSPSLAGVRANRLAGLPPHTLPEPQRRDLPWSSDLGRRDACLRSYVSMSFGCPGDRRNSCGPG